MFKRIIEELKHHAPFTLFGAIVGILLILPFQGVSSKIAYDIFYVFHPLHVLLSALVTASLYNRYKCGEIKGKCNLFAILLIGYFGSVGIATLSDSLMPFLGETLLNMPHRHAHIGFIEKWWLVNPLALIGIAIAYFRPTTKFPHSAHVLLSTWATLFHIIMALGGRLSWFSYISIFAFLFLSVWIPCCLSDIVFPLLFVKDAENRKHAHLR